MIIYRNCIKNKLFRNLNTHYRISYRFISSDPLWEDEIAESFNPSIDELYKCSNYHEYLTDRVRKYMKLSPEDLDKKSFYPVELLQETFYTLHNLTGLPWWFIISTFTITLKVVMLPLFASAERNRRKNAAVMPILVDLQNRIFESKRDKNHKEMLKLQRELFMVISEKKVIKTAFIQGAMSGFQFATFYWVYATQRSLCRSSDKAHDFILEAPLWLDSIALPDPYYILPTFAAALLLTIYNHNLATKNAIRDEQALQLRSTAAMKKNKSMSILSKIAIYSFIFISYSMPAGAFLYLGPSFAFHVLLRYATKNDSFCRFFQLGKVIN